MSKNKNITAKEAGSAVVNAADLMKASSTEQVDQAKETQLPEVVEAVERPLQQTTEVSSEEHAPAATQQQAQEPEQAPIIPAIVVDTGGYKATAEAKGFINQHNPELQNRSEQSATGNAVPKSLKERILARQAAAVEGAAALTESLKKILADVPPANQTDIIRIRQYCAAMSPGRSISEAQGAQEQVALYRSIQNIINRQEDYFTPLFTALLKIFASEADGAMCDTQRNRFDSHVALSKEDRKAFRNISHLLTVMADPKSRGVMKNVVNVETALEVGFTEEGRNRVIGYFG